MTRIPLETVDHAAGIYVQKWKPLTAYLTDQPVVNPSGDVVKAKVAFTSGAAYDATNWTGSAVFVPKWQATTAYAIGDPVVNPAGDVVKRKTAGTSRATYDATEAALWASSSTYASHAEAISPNSVVLFGDSITALNTSEALASTNTYYDSYGYFNWFQIYTGHRCTFVANKGVGGDTTTMMLARLTTDVLGQACSWVIMNGGANDIGNVALATTQANLAAMWTAIIQSGKRVVFFTINPSVNYAGASKQDLWTLNRWAKEWAQANYGLLIADGNAMLSDPATAAPLAGLTQDGVHPNFWGAALMGKALANVLEPHLVGSPRLLESNADTGNLLANGMMEGTAGTNGSGPNNNLATPVIADSWSISAAGTGAYDALVTKVARTDGKRGTWQQIKINALAGTVQLAQAGVTGWAVGDKVYAQIEYETGTDAADSYQHPLAVVLTNGTIKDPVYRPGTDGILTGLDVYGRSGVLRSPVYTILAGATTMDFTIPLKAVGTWRFSRAEIRKVP
jgi:lysophospholipase L1-like esterase